MTAVIPVLLFHGKGRNGERYLLPLAPCGSIRVSGENRQPGGKPALSGASRQLSRRESLLPSQSNPSGLPALPEGEPRAWRARFLLFF